MKRRKDLTWVLTNPEQGTLCSYVKSLSRRVLRNCPEQLVIVNLICTFENGHIDKDRVHRVLDNKRRVSIIDFLHYNETELVFFFVQFESRVDHNPIKLTLSGLAPFDHIELIGDNVPSWFQALVERNFRPKSGLSIRLSHFLQGLRPVKSSVS